MRGGKKGRLTTMQTKPIPSTGESLPVIGCGTYLGFDVAPKALAKSGLSNVLSALFNAGGSVIDSSPMYGNAEASVGTLLENDGLRRKAFLATKVWTRGREAGIRQMEASFALLRTDRIDLMQIHNLVDWKVHLPTLRDWKAKGRIRYLGVSHYTSSAYGDLEAVMRSEPLDFVQLNYSVADRLAERRLLPLAAERGMAVLVNVPFGSGSVLHALGSRVLPAWANEIGCTSWPQLFLKFVVSHPAVTCAIPGTGDAAHMADNASAGQGEAVDEAIRERIANASG
ncbi:MAG: aldo/keto reductase [Gemmatimonadetes bacterium]|nr:aldo/keto reductase [Gemmatimonadota bacterium]